MVPDCIKACSRYHNARLFHFFPIHYTLTEKPAYPILTSQPPPNRLKRLRANPSTYYLFLDEPHTLICGMKEEKKQSSMRDMMLSHIFFLKITSRKKIMKSNERDEQRTR